MGPGRDRGWAVIPTPTRDYEARKDACLKACTGLTGEQVAAIPQVLKLASELAALVETTDEYQPGTDLFTVGEVLKLALAGARS